MVKTYPVPLTKEEMDKLIEASMENDFVYMLFIVAKTTGRRIGEYYDIRVKDIDFDKKIMVTKVLKRKRRVEKEAILNDESCRLLKQYIKKNSLKLEDYIFRKYTYRHLQNFPKLYAKKAGIDKNVQFHNFRHYFVTALVKKGWSYDKIAKLTGHSSPETIKHYDHAVASDIEEDAREAIDDL